jgi:hypothetical protein
MSTTYDVPDAEKVVTKGKATTATTEKTTLNASERKVLTELVDNDFYALSSQMQQAHQDRLRAISREEQAAQEEQRARSAEWQDKAKALNEKQRKERQTFIERAERAGLTFAVGRGEAGVAFSGIPSSVSQARKDADADFSQAQTVLREQQAHAHRLILLAGVPSTGPARELLDSIPSAEALLRAAAAERQSKAITKE